MRYLDKSFDHSYHAIDEDTCQHGWYRCNRRTQRYECVKCGKAEEDCVTALAPSCGACGGTGMGHRMEDVCVGCRGTGRDVR